MDGYDPEETEYDADIQRRIFDPIFGDVWTAKETAGVGRPSCERLRVELRERWGIMVGNRFCGIFLLF
jgi:hypothetical protein